MERTPLTWHWVSHPTAEPLNAGKLPADRRWQRTCRRAAALRPTLSRGQRSAEARQRLWREFPEEPPLDRLWLVSVKPAAAVPRWNTGETAARAGRPGSDHCWVSGGEGGGRWFIPNRLGFIRTNVIVLVSVKQMCHCKIKHLGDHMRRRYELIGDETF